MNSSVPYARNSKTQRGVPHTDAELCLNCWYFVDDGGVVLRLAVKPYALHGSDEEKLSVLKALAGADHLTAYQGNVPQRYVLDYDGEKFQGAIPAAAISMDPIPVFEDLFQMVIDALPDIFCSKDDTYHQFKMTLVEPFLWVLTAVHEAGDGTLVARIA